MILPSSLALRAGAGLALLSVAGTAWPALGWAAGGGILALALAVVVDGRRLPPRCVTWTRRVPRGLSLGVAERLVDEWRNHTAFVLDVTLGESYPADLVREPAFTGPVRLPPHARVRVTFRLRASRRGERHLPAPVLRVGRVHGLAVRQWGAPEGVRLSVTPNVERLRRYEVLRQSRALAGFGIHVARGTGLGSEFDHLRLYGRDDDYRRIDWKATARRGRPVTRVLRVERDQSVLLALDCSHWMGLSAGALSRLDFAVDAALFLAHVARRSGDRVGVCLFAHEVLTLLPPSSRPGQVHRILDALTAARPHGVHPSYRGLARHLLARRLRRSLVVVLSEPIDDDSARDLGAALVALRGRHVPLAVSLQDPAVEADARLLPDDVQGLCRRLAASEVQGERAERLRRRHEQGIPTLDVLPRNLAVSLVNRYLELKSRGSL